MVLGVLVPGVLVMGGAATLQSAPDAAMMTNRNISGRVRENQVDRLRGVVGGRRTIGGIRGRAFTRQSHPGLAGLIRIRRLQR